jgi:hypothetical protein
MEVAQRNLLHKSKIDDFKTWLDLTETPYRDGKGEWQALQVKTAKHGWQVVYSRADMPEHYTVSESLAPLVRAFIRDAKNSERIAMKDHIAALESELAELREADAWRECEYWNRDKNEPHV